MKSMVAALDSEIKSRGGYVNAHAHFDRAYTVTRDQLCSEAYRDLKEKWTLVDQVKRASSVEDYYNRITHALIQQKMFGVTACLSFIDVDECCEMRAIEAAVEAKKFAKDLGVEFKIACQVLKGVMDPRSRKWFLKSLDYVDVIGGLPARDEGYEQAHIDFILRNGKETGKRVHVHVDQLDSNTEKETELLALRTVELGMQGRVSAVHSISVASHSKAYRERVYSACLDAGLSFICCPTAWIDRRRREDLLPVHNSVTPVDELAPRGIKVALGCDNICDIYKPYSDGNMLTETRVMLESTHFYDFEEIVKIATENGKEVIS